MQLSIEGPSGGDWTLVREAFGVDAQHRADRLAERLGRHDRGHGLADVRPHAHPGRAEARSTVTGDSRLASHILEAFALVS